VQVEHLQQLADHGDAAAQTNLGYRQLLGLGVGEDTVAARAAFERAAAAGEPLAGFNLGVLHLRGLGVAQNETRARELFEAAHGTGVAAAADSLAQLYYHGIGVPQDRAYAWCAATTPAPRRHRLRALRVRCSTSSSGDATQGS
jgi:uncharacterized protein